jgi:hypothetical protein
VDADPRPGRADRAALTCALGAASLAWFAACGGGTSVHPPQPAEGHTAPIPDPRPGRVVFHVSVFPEAILQHLEESLPKTGSGFVDLVAGRTLPYEWTREPVALRFDRGRLLVSTKVNGSVRFLGERNFTVKLSIAGEPVMTPDYQAELQSTEVSVSAEGSLEAVNRAIEQNLRAQIAQLLEDLKLDARPLVRAIHGRIAAPIPLPLSGPSGPSGPSGQSGPSGPSACAELKVAALEAGPNVLARGVEKDLGVVVLPSVSLPCPKTSTVPTDLPLLANVSGLPSGPFNLVVPIAAEYGELSKAFDGAIHGRLHFSKEYPGLYLEKPRISASDETIVLMLVLGGTLDLAGGTSLAGELYFTGHPRVVDNQITVPDLELTPGTADGLLKLKFLLDGKAIRDQAQAALRVDISEQLAAVKDKLGKELTFSEGLGCVRGEVLRAEVTGIFAHQTFLRLYVSIDAQASIFLPCKR